MRANRKPAKPNWRFDGTTITVRIPVAFDRRGGRKVIIAPDGGDAWVPVRPHPDEAMIRALVRAHPGDGCCKNENTDPLPNWPRQQASPAGFVNRLIRLTLLAPDIIEAILDGRQPCSSKS